MKTARVRFVAEAAWRVARSERVFTRDQERAMLLELGRLARQTREASGTRSSLTDRELEILWLAGDGLSVKQLTSRLGAVSAHRREPSLEAVPEARGTQPVQALSRRVARSRRARLNAPGVQPPASGADGAGGRTLLGVTSSPTKAVRAGAERSDKVAELQPQKRRLGVILIDALPVVRAGMSR